VLSDFESDVASSPSVAACTGLASKSPPAKIKTKRSLALLIIWQSPRFASPGGEKDRTPCPQRGRKGESSDKSGHKRGSLAVRKIIAFT
jgi:hypothetical protein